LRDTNRRVVPACKAHYRWVSTVERSTQSEKFSKYSLRSKLRIAQFTKSAQNETDTNAQTILNPRGYWLY
jgi:hypothetical protein